MRWDVLTAAHCQYVSCPVHKGRPCHQHFFQSAWKFILYIQKFSFHTQKFGLPARKFRLHAWKVSLRARKFCLHGRKVSLHPGRTQNWTRNNEQLWLAVSYWPQALCKEPGVNRIREVQLYCLGICEPLDGRVFMRLPVDRFP